MSWFHGISTKRARETALRKQVLAVHGRIVDRVLKITEENHWDMVDDFIFRFDVMVFLVSAVLRHLHEAEQPQENRIFSLFSQMLWDITFESFEESLHHRGVSDIRMAARMRKLLQHAMGRRNAYLDAWETGEDQEAIRRAVARNVFNGAQTTDPRIDIFLANLQGFIKLVLPDHSNL